MNFHIHKRLVILIIAVLILILISLCIVLFYRYSEVSPERVINKERFSKLAKDDIALGLNDVQMIASWMTFDYINHVFRLPPQYLKLTLGINDSQYPHLTISRYAQENKIAEGVFIAQIQNTVKNYFITPVSQ